MNQAAASLPILNISFYKFTGLGAPVITHFVEKGAHREAAYTFCERLHAIRAEIFARVKATGEASDPNSIKGTIILAPEGINGFLAAPEHILRPFMEGLPALVGEASLDFKESFSETSPFWSFRCKLKAEIIPFGKPEIQPTEFTGKRLYPEELKAWLDSGKEIVLIDTRNEFEIEYGTFKGAKRLGVGRFRQFPKIWEKFVAEHPLKPEVPVVMFCTGGIRCEKSSALARSLGHDETYQLEGGILRYFEKVGAEHYDGTCFVFDQREALDGNLSQSG